jgi:hypothetical protein
MGIIINRLGGQCPVQGEGTINSKRFYFRARDQHWSIGIGNNPVCNPEWYWREPYGTAEFVAGWMGYEEAEAFIRLAAKRYMAGEEGMVER